MSQEEVNRKLSCILSTDVVGYSRLMEENEASTVRYLEANKRLISKLIEGHNGRVVDSPGDNLLAEFISAVKAVDCAVKIQKELKIRNAELVESRRMQFRIGINLGDVIEEDGRLYGSGVNIAARLEGLAEPGGICISRNVYDQVKTKLDVGYEYLGEHEVKNISEPVRVYRVQTGNVTSEKVVDKNINGGLLRIRNIAIVLIIVLAGLLVWGFYPSGRIKIESESVETKQTLATPEVKKVPKSIAVLAFENISPDKDQEYFADGLSEEILNSLAQIPDLLVTGRTSSFSFKGSHKKVQEIANELGVKNILEGSVRKAGNTLRVTAQLLRGSDGFHLWSKSYDRELKSAGDILDIQEDIAIAVANELKLALEVGSIKQLGDTDNMEAYEFFLVSKGQAKSMEFEKSLDSINSAISIDPEFALAWAWKSIIHANLGNNGTADQTLSELDSALEAAQKAVSLEPALGKAYLSLGSAYMLKGDFIKAEEYYRKGIALTTESIDYFEYGLIWHYMNLGYIQKSYQLLENLKQKDPFQKLLRGLYFFSIGITCDFEKAEKEYKSAKEIFGDNWFYGDGLILILRLGAIDDFTDNDIPEYYLGDLERYLESPEDGLAEIKQLYRNGDNLANYDYMAVAVLAAYFGDLEFCLDVMENRLDRGTGNLATFWAPLFYEVRKQPGFKKLVREAGLVDYWKTYSWPDLCHPVGDDDFVCD